MQGAWNSRGAWICRSSCVLSYFVIFELCSFWIVSVLNFVHSKCVPSKIIPSNFVLSNFILLTLSLQTLYSRILYYKTVSYQNLSFLLCPSEFCPFKLCLVVLFVYFRAYLPCKWSSWSIMIISQTDLSFAKKYYRLHFCLCLNPIKLKIL